MYPYFSIKNFINHLYEKVISRLYPPPEEEGNESI